MECFALKLSTEELERQQRLDHLARAIYELLAGSGFPPNVACCVLMETARIIAVSHGLQNEVRGLHEMFLPEHPSIQ
jgi:hypothetical protein